LDNRASTRSLPERDFAREQFDSRAGTARPVYDSCQRRAQEPYLTLNDEVDQLTQIPLFSNLDPSKLKLLAFSSERLSFEAGQVLFRQGDLGESAYIIMDGEVDIIVEGKVGEISVARVGKGELIGEISVLIDVPRTATVRAVTKLTTLEVSKELFLRMVTSIPELGVHIMRELAGRLQRTTERLARVRSGM
jgi:CRP-like cAMP-binding protein